MEKTASSSASGSSLRRAPYLWLFLFALAFRFIYIAESARNPLFGVPLVDGKFYDDWARRIAGGQYLWTRVENYLPIYPYFLALLKIFFGENPAAVKWAQGLMGAVACLLTAKAGERIWDRRSGLAAGYLMAAYWMLAVYESEPFAESFSIFFQAVAIFLLLGRQRSVGAKHFSPGVLYLPSPAVPQGDKCFAPTDEGIGDGPRLHCHAFLAGVAFALCAGARANLLLLFPALAGWLVWRHRKSWRRCAFSTAAFVVGVGLILGPILLWNHRLTGAWMLRAQAAWSLYSGLDPKFGGLPIPPGVAYDNYMRLPIRAGLRSETQIEKFWIEKTRRLLRERPLGVLGVIARRALMLLSAQEFSKEFDVYAYRNYSWFLSLPWIGFWAVGPLGVLGVLTQRRWTKGAVLALVFLAVGVLSVIPFKFADRYRLPSAPLFALFAGAAIWRLADWARRGDWRRFGWAAAALAFLCLASWPDWLGLRERRIARHDFFLGLQFQRAGRGQEAMDAFARSMARYPWDADSPFHLGLLQSALGRPGEALKSFDEALRRQAEFPEAMAEKARILLDRGDTRQAESLTSESARLYPNSPEILFLMARIRRLQGRIPEEIEFCERAIREGGDAREAVELALRLEQIGRAREALPWYDWAIQRSKENPFAGARAAMLAGNLCARVLRDTLRAKAYWRLAAEKFPGEPFFRDQAEFLAGKIGEEEYRRRFESSSSAAAREFGQYNIGLARWMAGRREDALQAYEECLRTTRKAASASASSPFPQGWAEEDIRSIGSERHRSATAASRP